jgi:amidase
VDGTELAFAGVARQAELVRAGEVSSRELVELYLERIGRLEPELSAFRVVLSDRALADADQADARRQAGQERPLLGVPIAVKDNQDLAGEVTTHGTVANRSPAAEDAELVRGLRAAGAVVIGKTRLSELAIWPYTLSTTWGATRNPWDPERTPGGSSGGSGAAVAAGLASAATASDGGGSIRVPAACCGIFGLKPQRGRVSLMPDAEHWHGLSAAGVVTRRVADTAVLLDAMAGPAPGDTDSPPAPPRPFTESASSDPGSLRIALSTRPPAPARVEREVREAAEAMAELLRRLGHEVRERSVDYPLPTPLFLPRWLRGIRDDASRIERPERLERRTRDTAAIGERVPEAWLRWARRKEPEFAARVNQVFNDHDVVLTPHPASLPPPIQRVHHRGTARTILEAANFVTYDVPWNLTGQPAASIPAGWTDEGLPLSVQLVGRPNDEGTLLSLAGQVESETGWPERHPPTFSHQR